MLETLARYWDTSPQEWMSLHTWHIVVWASFAALCILLVLMLYLAATHEHEQQLPVARVQLRKLARTRRRTLREWGDDIDRDYPNSLRTDEYADYARAVAEEGQKT